MAQLVNPIMGGGGISSVSNVEHHEWFETHIMELESSAGNYSSYYPLGVFKVNGYIYFLTTSSTFWYSSDEGFSFKGVSSGVGTFKSAAVFDGVLYVTTSDCNVYKFVGTELEKVITISDNTNYSFLTSADDGIYVLQNGGSNKFRLYTYNGTSVTEINSSISISGTDLAGIKYDDKTNCLYASVNNILYKITKTGTATKMKINKIASSALLLFRSSNGYLVGRPTSAQFTSSGSGLDGIMVADLVNDKKHLRDYNVSMFNRDTYLDSIFLNGHWYVLVYITYTSGSSVRYSQSILKSKDDKPFVFDAIIKVPSSFSGGESDANAKLGEVEGKLCIAGACGYFAMMQD